MDSINAGHGAICRDCDNLVRELFEGGHPNPCRLVRWEKTKHLAPTLAGGRCDGFEPRAEEDGNQTAVHSDASRDSDGL